ncbi:MAG TPA: class I SAM-dependent methyltransferase [Acidobacteriaceae bacterium]|nr:class I SAM-dependent methyltransferase [Acidobacteriaceae bacterium]
MPRRKSIAAIHPFDVRHGTDTSGIMFGKEIARGTAIEPDDLTAYYGVAPSILETVLDHWLQLTAPKHSIERYTFLDIGAGKGRAMLLASQFPFAAIEGVELNEGLIAIAQRNIEIWQRDPRAAALAPITLHNADATAHPLPDGPILAFLFHPFETVLLRRFLRHIESELTRKPRAFDLIYVNAEHGSSLDHHPAFTRLWEGRVAMSAADHVADLAAIAEQKEYGSTGDELCSVYRFTGRLPNFDALRAQLRNKIETLGTKETSHT